MENFDAVALDFCSFICIYQKKTVILQAVEVIKTAILQSQERTIKTANADVLSLNYAVGGFISQQANLHKWGSGIIRAISEKLQRDMPGLRGFGYENLKKMRQFYETWLPYIIGSPSATELELSENGSPMATQMRGGFMPALALFQSRHGVTR